jgi:hypothetical protein
MLIISHNFFFCVEVPLSNEKLYSTRNSYFQYSFCVTHYDIIYFSQIKIINSYAYLNHSEWLHTDFKFPDLFIRLILVLSPYSLISKILLQKLVLIN